MTRPRTPKASRRRQALISFLSGALLPQPVAKPQRRRGRRGYAGMRFEALEDRRMLAHVTLNAGILQIADITGVNTNDQLTISHSNGSYSISDSIFSPPQSHYRGCLPRAKAEAKIIKSLIARGKCFSVRRKTCRLPCFCRNLLTAYCFESQRLRTIDCY